MNPKYAMYFYQTAVYTAVMSSVMTPNDLLAIPDFILDKFPGYFIIKDMNGMYTRTCENTANLFGFKRPSDVIGLQVHEIKCAAAQYADDFIAQDNIIINKDKDMSILDIHPYQQDIPETFLMKKSLMKDSEGTNLGIACICMKLDDRLMTEFSHHLNSSNPTKTIGRQQLAANYYLNECYGDHGLTARESECLFFVLRGQTAKNIATMLSISIRTVETHIANIKSKMGCIKKSELIEKAVVNGYLEILPERIMQNPQLRYIVKSL